MSPDAPRARLRPEPGAEHQARPRRPPAEVPESVRDRGRSSQDRAPDHAGAGGTPRLPGIPSRGRSRAALRQLRPGAAVHIPQPFARPRADRDLLVHLRGDLARGRPGTEYFDLSAEQAEENAEATVFLEALLFRRYTAKLGFELEFWGGFGNGGGPARTSTTACSRRRPEPYRPDAYLAGHGRRLLFSDLPPGRIRSASCDSGCCARSARIGGAAARPATTCAHFSPKGRSRPARRSRAGSASIPDTQPLLSELGA